MIQKRLLDSEIGSRDFVKNRPEGSKNRLIQTGMGHKQSPGATHFGDMINSGASIVMSKVHKIPAPSVDQKTEGDEPQ